MQKLTMIVLNYLINPKKIAEKSNNITCRKIRMVCVRACAYDHVFMSKKKKVKNNNITSELELIYNYIHI